MRHSQCVALAGAVAMVVAIALAAPVAAADPDVVVVASGENLTVIAARHGTSVSQLVTLNGLSDANRIYAGQRLRVRAARSAAPARPAAAPGAGTYVVKPGDSLWGIAQRTGVSVSSLTAANRLANPQLIFAGQRLTIPGAQASRAAAAVRATPAPATSPQPRAAAAAAAPAPAAAAAAAQRRHRVAAGESLWTIAQRYRTTVAALAAANSIANPALVFVGQQLVVPAGAPTSGGGSSARLPAEMAGLVAARAGIGRIIIEEANRYGVPPALALAVAWHESGWQADVVSSADAVGVMQLLPTTGEWVSEMLGAPVELTDPRSNIRGGVRLLRHYLDRYAGNRDLVLAAYYQGQGAVDKHGIYRVSRPYIASVRVLERVFAGWAG